MADAGAAYLYLFPCAYEDLCKLGISRDPLARVRAFAPRYYEFFDLERAALLQADTPRQARQWETALKRELRLLNAPAPLLVPGFAAGHTEWFRGGYAEVLRMMRGQAAQGFVLHLPARDWLRQRLQAERERFYEWSTAMLQALAESGANPGGAGHPLAAQLRDACDAYAALGLDLEAWSPPELIAWYRQQ